ncbi:hypothetical protein G4493_05675 [Roseburia intestinalis]|nr:hypothetical protein [Roseburia intestinalis]
MLSAKVRPGAENGVFEICEALYPGRTAVLPLDRRSRFLCQSCRVPACTPDRRNL